MKKLIVSIKKTEEVLRDFKRTYKELKSGKCNHSHYEISFSDLKQFYGFIKNLDILIAIKKLRPDSVYDLAKKLKMDQSNLNKIISFFEEQGVIRIKKTVINNRTVKRPTVDYNKIEFDLDAA